MSKLRQATLLLAALLSLATPAARAQLVNDDTTNVLSGVTTNLSGTIIIGTSAPNTLLVLSNGTELTTSNGSVHVGLGGGAASSGVWVTGAGTRWRMSNQFNIGINGLGSFLVVSNGGQVLNEGISSIGQQGGYDFATVTGAGSLWSNQTLRVGYYGGTNQLTVADGGTVIAETTKVGGIGEWEGNTITVSGGGSLFSNITELLLGENSGENTLIISNGGTVYSALGNVGGYGGSWGAAGGAESNRVLIDGAGSSWVANRFSLGVASRGNEMRLTNGGTLRVLESGLILGEYGYFAPSNNLLAIDGGNVIVTNAARTNTYDIRWGTNLFNSGYMEVDNLVMTNAAGTFVFNGGTLVTHGAIISNGQDFIVGDNAGYGPATWDVRSNSTPTVVWNSLDVGSGAGNASLLITNGATLVAGRTNEWSYFSRLGVKVGATNNRVIVSGASSRWIIHTLLRVGDASAGNLLLVTNGGHVTSRQGEIGSGFSAMQNRVVVTGTNSVWSYSGILSVGHFGKSNVLLICHGGRALGEVGYVGANSGANDNTVVVSNAGSLWSNSYLVSVGNSGSFNKMWVADGGAVVSGQGRIGPDYTSFGNQVMVSGYGSIWSNSGLLTVGSASKLNELTVTNGGAVVSGGAEIGGAYFAMSNRVTVTGSDSVWLNDGAIRVGGLGSFNALRIGSGGNVFASSATVGNTEGGTGNVLQLDQGTLTVSGGLTISSNNSLLGAGNIIGTVTNFGTITPGNSAGAITIHGDLRLRDSASLVFEIGGLIPTNQYDVVTVTNFVEFAGTLSLSLLPGFLPEAADSFALMSFGSASGSFANVSGGRVSLTNNLASFAVTMSTTNLVLSGAQYVDTDGDGQGDLQEQAAGTDAADPASALAILSVTLNGAGHSVVRFQSVAGQSYRVEYSDNFTTWSTATGAVFTNPLPGVSEWVDDGTLTGGLPAGGRAYRIGLQ